MRILIKRENFSTSRYELQAGSAALEFTGEDGKFSLPYKERQASRCAGYTGIRRVSGVYVAGINYSSRKGNGS